ncbi:MAG: GFA family protein [Nannocystaceae bacterium]
MPGTRTTYQGRCLCGDVRFQATPPTLFFAHCHCRWCQSAHGAAFVSWVGLAEKRFEIVAGNQQVRWYKSTPQSSRGFCSHCGTTLLFTSELCPGEVHVTRTSLEGELDRSPQLHCFFDQHVDWVTIADELPRVNSDAPGLAKYRVVGAP